MPTVPQDLVAGVIWRAIEARGSLTRTQLEAFTGLPKSTVTEHVRVMLRQRILEEITPLHTGSRGRPARVLIPASSGFATGVIVLSHSTELVQGPVRVAFGSSRGFIRWMRTADADGSPLTVAAELIQAGLIAMPELVVRQFLLVLPLPVVRRQEQDDGLPALRVIEPLADLLGATPQDWLSSRLGAPVAIANDADMGALGEATFGAHRVADLIYMKTLHGLGMGVVSGGELVEPTEVPVGELAHVRRPGNDIRCRCGTVGCWFTSGSVGPGLLSRVQAQGVDVSSLSELQSRCVAGDSTAQSALTQVGSHIGEAFAQFATLSGRFTVLLEHGLQAVFEPFVQGLQSALASSNPDWMPRLRVRQGMLGDEAEVLGGFEYVRAGSCTDRQPGQAHSAPAVDTHTGVGQLFLNK